MAATRSASGPGSRALPSAGFLAGLLPRASPDEAAGIAPAPARILVVDDDWFVRLQIERFLGCAGFEVVGIATDAAAAVSLADRLRPDLVLMDIRLAGPVDGVTAATEIADRFGIRCLFVSAHTDQGTITRTLAARPAGWVPKPFTEAELLQGVRAALAGP
jgi:DNA-binding NarL/FixJ family response regulator